MKKLLILILAILLAILAYFTIVKDITIVKWNNKNVSDIKASNEELKSQIDVGKQLNNQEYPETVAKLEEDIKNLKIAKEKYENKIKGLSENVQLGVVEIKEYKVERLWVVLENYAKDENIELKIDILDTASAGVYDLNVTVVGGYIGITDFIYDIEKDDTLGFRILNFKLIPNATITTTNETGQDTLSASVDTTKLKATFTIENVGIEFN